MSNVFAAIERATLVEDPFPHLVVQDALPADIADTFLAEMPSVEVLAQGRPIGSNVRFYVPSAVAFADPRIAEPWKGALRTCLDSAQGFLDLFIRRLGDHLRTTYPQFETQFAPLDQLRARPRAHKGRQKHEVGMDFQMVVNSPALTSGTSVRGAHLDQSNKLISGLLYLRTPDDDSVGGELELYASAVDKVSLDQSNNASSEQVRFARRYPYRHNLLVLPLNSPLALHGVSPRGKTAKPRYHLHLVGEMTAPLFETPRSKAAA